MTLYLIANDIRSAENIGALFRTCDSLGVSKLWIAGYSPTPDHPKVKKTALGAEANVAWERELDVRALIARLKSEGYQIVALEIADRAVNLAAYKAHPKTALLLGNEVTGIPPSLQSVCDDVVSISQKGMKESLNVSVAAGIASYWMLHIKNEH